MRTKLIVLATLLLLVGLYAANMDGRKTGKYEYPSADETVTPTENGESSAPITTPTPGRPAPLPGTSPTGQNGRIVFGVTDKAVGLDNIDSIYLTVASVKIHNPKSGWLTISQTPKTYDLLKLKATGRVDLLADTTIPAGEYDMIRLVVGNILITNRDKTVVQAKIPSNELRINSNVKVFKNSSSSVLVDFLADKSLHTTGDNKIIFSPVVMVETKSETTIQTLPVEGSPHSSVQFLGGNTNYNATIGMDENGVLKVNGGIDARADLEIVGGAIHLIPKDNSEANIKITSSQVLDLLIKEKHLDNALSIKTVNREGKLVWRVVGTKNLEVAIVYVDVTSGNVIATE